MNLDISRGYQPMLKSLSALALLLLLCVPLNADLIFSFDFYDVGTSNTLTQPINMRRHVRYGDYGNRQYRRQ